jgi:deoxyribodipyrimidine photo-lyase
MHCIWFRQDLRIYDNTALTECCDNAQGVVAVFVLTPKTWQRFNWASCKVDFMLRQLQQLSGSLADLNIPLKVLSVPSYSKTPQALLDFCVQHQVQSVFVNRQLLVDEINRDALVASQLAGKQIEFNLFDDLTVLPPAAVLKKDGTPFKVFTPFKNNWLKIVTPDDYQPYRAPRKQNQLSIKLDEIPMEVSGFKKVFEDTLWPVGEKAAQKKLVEFCKSKVDSYEKERNFPDLSATSQLSPYLCAGILSVRQCIAALLKVKKLETVSGVSRLVGVACWLSELIWREFYMATAYHFVQVVKNKPFKPETDRLPWSSSPLLFKAWCEGLTGFPLVDAAMRQLNQTGWMHNRLRMVVAMFLTKTLFLDWRLGERYFMQRLIDGEFAANNGGWQWSASTGTDAAPYFRIFNPTTQSERFDAGGEFIRQFCPEIAGLPAKSIHNPSSSERKLCGYPEPIVDYRLMREKVIQAFKRLKKL